MSVAIRWESLYLVRRILCLNLYRKSLKWFSKYDLFQEESIFLRHSGEGGGVSVNLANVATIDNLLDSPPDTSSYLLSV